MDLSQVSWQGYERKNGSLGIRNKILVIYTVKCSEFAAEKIVQRCGYENVEYIGFDGCTDNQYAINMLISFIRHPNTGAVLVVGLGCEYVQAKWLADIGKAEGKASEWILIQQAGGTRKAIELGIRLVTRLEEALEKVPRKEMFFKDLVIGAECGGSDFTSGLAGNVVVGRFYDKLTAMGGTAIFEEVVEMIGLDQILLSRAANEKAGKEIASTYNKMLDYCRAVRQYSISPGNFAGGLTTIEEKSMGALIKSGSRNIEGVIKVSERPPYPGLWMLDSTPDPYWMQFGITNPNDSEGLMDLISAGAHIVLLVTGRGNVVGSAVSPCIKITGNEDTYRRMEDDMDFDASPVLRGKATQEEQAESLEELIVRTASGEKTKSEVLGHREFYIPYKYQEKGRNSEKRCSEKK